MEYSHHPQHPEDYHSGEEENRNYGEQANQTVKGKDELHPRHLSAAVSIQKLRGPYPQNIFYAKEYRSDDLHHPEDSRIGAELVKSLQHHHEDVQHYIRHQDIVKNQTVFVTLLGCLYNFVDFFLHVPSKKCQFLSVF